MESQEKEKYDFLIVFPLQEEFNYFIDIIQEKESKRINSNYYYIFDFPDTDFRAVALIAFEPGINRTIHLIDVALSYFNVDMIVMIGIAGGIGDDLKLGDLIIPETVIEYEADSKAVEDENMKKPYLVERSPKHWSINDNILNFIRNFSNIEKELYKNYQDQVKKFVSSLTLEENLMVHVTTDPKYLTNKLLSGNIVGTATEFINEIKSIDRKIIGIEMEAAGALRAASELSTNVPTLIIRGISDFADDRKKEFDNIQKGIFRELAARNASLFFLTIIQSKTFKDIQEEFFRFHEYFRLDERQKNIVNLLSQEPYDARELNNLYLGALRVLNDENNPDRFYQCAYSLHHLILKLINPDNQVKLEEKDVIYEKVESFLDQNDSSFRNSVNFLFDIFSYFQEISTHSNKILIIEKIFNQKLESLELIIWSRLSRFYDILSDLQELMNIPEPTQDIMEEVEIIINARNDLFREFFLNLRNPEWLHLLDQNGYFDIPEDKNAYMIQTVYLEKVATEKSEKVVEIIKRLSNIKNWAVRVNFLKTILNLSIQHIEKLVDEIKSWIETPISKNYSLYELVKNLIEKLFSENALLLAREISEEIFDVEKYYNKESS
ncbi:MAG: hypothetical protein GF311_02155 [Candidatus Lokiarchaeota archaeon]|nr:hypothetical protein [Candidatus Lokiarchaeota archaeon]